MNDEQRFKDRKRTVIARGAYASLVSDALLGKAETKPFDAAGRGSVALFDLPDGQGVLRKCRRGGLVGKVVSEGYVLKNRPLAEFRVHEHLYETGLAVPEPLGVMWERAGLVWRGAIATRRVEGVGLPAWFHLRRQGIDADSPPPQSSPLKGEEEETSPSLSSQDSVLHSVGALIRSMHDAGVYHADLHVENILVDTDNRVLLIDFDNAAISSRLSSIQRARNLLRLRRSFLKRGLPLDHYDAILSGYGAIAIPSWLDAAYRLKGRASDLLAAS